MSAVFFVKGEGLDLKYWIYKCRTPICLSRLPRRNASKWYSLSFRKSSSLDLVFALLWAASFAWGDMWLSLLSKQLDWAVMIETDSWRLSCWRRIDLSWSERTLPSMWEMWFALQAVSFLRRSCVCWLTSPYCPATMHCNSPKLWRRCWRGPTWPGRVLQYFWSMVLALSRYNLGICLAFLSTAFSFELYQLFPALRHLSSASWIEAGPCSAGKVMSRSGTNPCLAWAWCRISKVVVKADGLSRLVGVGVVARQRRGLVEPLGSAQHSLSRLLIRRKEYGISGS